MKKTVLLLTLCCALIACKQNNVDFTYSPTEPRAGEVVQFSNNSDSGEDWLWTFGDGFTSTIKSPSHTYKKPGTYRVILKVDNKSAWTATKEITIYDTIPTFVASDSLFYIYQDYTFTANVYNPYNYDVQYEWSFPINTPYTVVTDSTLTNNTLHLYFTKVSDAAPICLRIIMNGDTTLVRKTFAVQNLKTNSILIRTTANDYRQRLFGDRAEECKVDATSTTLLDAEQDTEQTYNGKTFTLADLSTTFPGIQGFHISNRKIYYRADGLWVANIDGANKVQIDTAACSAMTLGHKDSRIYWANAAGVWYMPFIGSDNNKFVTVPTQLNELENITQLAIDDELK